MARPARTGRPGGERIGRREPVGRARNGSAWRGAERRRPGRRRPRCRAATAGAPPPAPPRRARAAASPAAGARSTARARPTARVRSTAREAARGGQGAGRRQQRKSVGRQGAGAPLRSAACLRRLRCSAVASTALGAADHRRLFGAEVGQGVRAEGRQAAILVFGIGLERQLAGRRVEIDQRVFVAADGRLGQPSPPGALSSNSKPSSAGDSPPASSGWERPPQKARSGSPGWWRCPEWLRRAAAGGRTAGRRLQRGELHLGNRGHRRILYL